MSILPQPKQASKLVKTTGAGPRAAMIPYTLTKRPAPASVARRRKPVASNKAKPASVGGEDSDSDGEPVSFFSNLEPTKDDSAASNSHSNDTTTFSSYDNGGSELDVAPSAPKPFTVGEEEVGVASADPSWLVGGVDEQPPPAPGTQEVGPMLGAGPGLSMDDQAVSGSWCLEFV